MNYLWSPPPPVKYKGLKNQGATCYLNSVLQVLFMTDDFREAVERYPEKECIDRQLKSLFGKLSTQVGDTYDITNKLGIRQVYEQQDAAEYFEKILNLTSHEASQIFHGQLTNRTICLACCTQTDTDGQFWHLPLTLVDSRGEYNVVNGIEDYFRATTFSGENQMYCEQCDDKRDATIQCVIKHHPEVLMLLLKRFELDYYSMTYLKNNCTVLIPHTLQIPENQTYELYAVVDHVGDLRCGHYSAFIKSQEEDRWFMFDDARVTEVGFQPFQSGNFERSDRAYLLFYRKKSAPAADTRTPEDIREESAPGGCSPSTSDVDESQEAVVVNGGETVEETAEPGTDIKVVDERRVSVSSEDEVKPPEPGCDVDDLENRDNFMQGKHEENNFRNDPKLQDGEKDEGKTAPDNAEAEKKEDISGESLREESDENQDYESEIQNFKTVRQESPQEVRVDVQIENEGSVMEGKRGEGREEERERREKGRHQDSEGKDEVRQGVKGDPEGRQEGGEDNKSYRDVKRGGEKGMKGDFTAVPKVKSEADKVESRSGKPLTELDPVTKDDRVSKRGRSSRYGSPEQHRGENTDVQRAKEQKRSVTDKRSSDGNRQERAHPVHEVVSAAETRVKRRHSERTQDRNRSPTGPAAPVSSRSLTGDQREVRKGEKQAESDEGIVEEKQRSKEEVRRTPSGLEEITLETPPSGTRKRKSGVDLSKLLSRLNFHSRRKKRKVETPEQAAVERKNRRWRWRSVKRSKDKKKWGKTPSCFSFRRRKQSSESE